MGKTRWSVNKHDPTKVTVAKWRSLIRSIAGPYFCPHWQTESDWLSRSAMARQQLLITSPRGVASRRGSRGCRAAEVACTKTTGIRGERADRISPLVVGRAEYLLPPLECLGLVVESPLALRSSKVLDEVGGSGRADRPRSGSWGCRLWLRDLP